MFVNERRHATVMTEILKAINNMPNRPVVLKEGTALSLCYGLDRFSEDIDLDAPGTSAPRKALFSTIMATCRQKGYELRIAEDTNTVGRAIIHYDNGCTLKVEASY